MAPPLARYAFVALVSFLTLVDLFAAQALLPALTDTFAVSPAVMSSAVNASTLGMALSGLVIGLTAVQLDRRKAIWMSLLLLALPTLALSVTSDLTLFALLRILQGVLMSAAFTFTMTYLGETLSAEETAHALAAYVAGNVASNLVGRIVAAAAADHFGLKGAFVLFAALNVAGAVLVLVGLSRLIPAGARSSAMPVAMRNVGRAFSAPLRVCYALGFLILFCFIGTFSYVNFVLVAPPLNLDQMHLGWVYLVFIPALVTTPFAGRLVAQYGAQRVLLTAYGIMAVGLVLALLPQLTALLSGLALIGVGAFLAQAALTGQVGFLAGRDRAAASGFYLSSYYLGGLAGSIVVGWAFDALGWSGCILLMLIGTGLAARLAPATASPEIRVSRSPVGIR